MKKVFAFALSLVLAASLVSCGTSAGSTSSAAPAEGSDPASASPAAAGEKISATFVGVMKGGAAWGQAEAGFYAACAELGWEGQYVAPSTPNDTTVMVELTESALTNGANVLIGTYYSADIFGDVLKPAFEKGTYVASTNAFMTPDIQNFWIGTDPAGMGITQAKTLVDLVGGAECTVVYLQTQATSETQNQQFAAFSEELKNTPNIKIWGQEFCNSDSVAAAEKISNLVKANPQINAVVCADGNGCLGVANYVDETGNKDSFFSVGIDDAAEMLAYVTSGALDCTIAQDFYAMGYESCMMIKKLMDGGEVPFDNDSGTVVIKAADVEQYAADKGIALG